MQLDRDVFEELVRTHAAAVYRTARRVCRGDDDAADVTQQVFLAALQGRAELGADVAATGTSLRWLAGRYALNHLRAARRRVGHERLAAARETQMMEERQDRSAARDDHDLVRGALLELDDDVRVPLVLRYQEGLTLAGVAGVLGCAESTAHTRVQRALDTLRTRLQKLGFAAAAGSLESLLPQVAPSVAVPAGLEVALIQQVLAQAAGASGGAAAAGTVATASGVLAGKPVWAAALGAALLLGGGAAVALSGDHAPGEVRPVTVSTVGVESGAGHGVAAQDRPTAAPGDRGPNTLRRDVDVEPVADPAAATVPPAILRGRVVDSGTGAALEGVAVAAESEDRRSKLADHRIEARTDERGAFVLELPVDETERPEAYTLITTLADHVPFRSGRLLAHAGEELEALECPMRRWATDVEGEWRMGVVVVGPDGAPQQDAVVSVHRWKVRDDNPASHPQECSGRTDERGRVELAGTHRGEKMLRVGVFRSPLAPAKQWFRIDGARPEDRRVVLEIGGTITGRVVQVVDGTPVPGIWVEGTHEDGTRVSGRSDEGGRYELVGLAPGVCRLESTVNRYSPFRIDDVAVGASRDIQLKDLLDTQAHGDFLAEIHARIVDDVTGEPVAVMSWQHDTQWLPDEAVANGSWRQHVLPLLFGSDRRQRAAQQMEAVQVFAGQTDDGPGVAPGLRVERPTASIRASVHYDGHALLMVRAPDYAPAFVGPFEASPGRMHAGIEIRLTRGTTLEGVVRDAEGRPVEGAAVWLDALVVEADEQRARVVENLREGRVEGTTGAEGRFCFERVPQGYDVAVQAAHAECGDGASRTLVLRRGEKRREVDVILTR